MFSLYGCRTRRANERFRFLPKITRTHHYKIATRYVYVCERCGAKIGRHSRSIDTSKFACGKCGGRLALTVRMRVPSGAAEREEAEEVADAGVTASGDTASACASEGPTRTRTGTGTRTPAKGGRCEELRRYSQVRRPPASPFAQFVKGNFADVRKQNPGLSHGQIMSTLGARFKQMKVLNQ